MKYIGNISIFNILKVRDCPSCSVLTSLSLVTQLVFLMNPIIITLTETPKSLRVLSPLVLLHSYHYLLIYQAFITKDRQTIWKVKSLPSNAWNARDPKLHLADGSNAAFYKDYNFFKNPFQTSPFSFAVLRIVTLFFVFLFQQNILG